MQYQALRQVHIDNHLSAPNDHAATCGVSGWQQLVNIPPLPPPVHLHYLCCADYDILIAAGGDGTINQVVNELVYQDAPKETCLAVIPLGTANDFATSLTIQDSNLVQAMQTAVQGMTSILLLKPICFHCSSIFLVRHIHMMTSPS